MSREKNDASTWIDTVFRSLESLESPPSPEFVNRCKEVALAADAVAHMRSAAARHFHPLPFGQYVEQLAYAAGVELDKILTFVGLAHTKSASSLDRAIPAAIRLAFNLGIPREFLKVYLKLSCLALAGVPTAQLARLRSASNNANASLSAIENEIEGLAEKKGTSVLLEIRRRESEVDAVYDQEARTPF